MAPVSVDGRGGRTDEPEPERSLLQQSGADTLIFFSPDKTLITEIPQFSHLIIERFSPFAPLTEIVPGTIVLFR